MLEFIHTLKNEVLFLEFINQIMSFLNYSLDSAPKPYGLLHLLFIILTILICFVVVKLGRQSSEAKRKQFLLVVGIIMVVLEIYKELSYSYTDGVWKYQIDTLPFQFCSLPIYFSLIAANLKSCKIRDTLYTFLATYSLIGGVLVMLCPGAILVETLGVTIHSLIHHSLMISMGVYLLATDCIKVKKQLMIRTFKLFLLMVSIAFSLNLLAYNHADPLFNMFFISPYYSTDLPIGDWIQNNLGYIPFLTSYVMFFSCAAYLVLFFTNKIKISRDYDPINLNTELGNI